MIQRPYVICHMLQSIDGRIAGAFFHSNNTRALSKIYGEMKDRFEADGIIYGSVTANEIFTQGNKVSLSKEMISENRVNYIQDHGNSQWIIVIDPKGNLGWKASHLMNERLANKNVVVILSDFVSDAYCDYLKTLGISYIFGGKDIIDLTRVMNVLSSETNIKKLLLQGGGIINGSFMKEGLIDEISLIIAPNVDVSNKALCFEESEYSLYDNDTSSYRLVNSKALAHSGIWLNYKKTN